uniref:Nucleobase-ascorbate transporter 12 n=1 Tax=Anthurium amnicola TaxID=1678845 RepID=A0A1D1YST6_9ARAE
MAAAIPKAAAAPIPAAALHSSTSPHGPLGKTSALPFRSHRPNPIPVVCSSEPPPQPKWKKGRTKPSPPSASASASGQIAPPPRPPTTTREPEVQPDLESGRSHPSAPAAVNGEPPIKDRTPDAPPGADHPIKKSKEAAEAEPAAAAAAAKSSGPHGPVNGQPRSQKPRREDDVGSLPQVREEDEFVARRPHINYDLRDSPGLVPIAFYGLQHFLSMLASIILIPLVIIPAMGGTYDDTSTVVSTVLFISGLTTILHCFLGSRLPLVQGPSFVYLAPALAIINSPEFFGLTENNFKHIMRELQGAIIISSAFQVMMGYSGLASVFLRLVNPVVVAPTIASVGLSFFSYGFTRISTCLEIGMLQILLVIIFSLYLRRISIFGHRIFLIYAVPLGLGITWAVAFLLTEVGAYSYKGCDANVPLSNTVSDYCRKHVPRMKHCRVDTSHALKASPWFRFPYPLQWGTPIFNWKMTLVMCVVSIIALVDSVGSYHASSLLVASRSPTSGVVSRGIGLEGISSVLAGIWGTGTGSTTLTENVHTIAVTKMGSRRAVMVGAGILILLSLIGKVGGFIASIPDVMVAALLCFMWAMLAALGLSNLRYSEAGSSRNIIIVGLSLFFSLSVPAYFQQYGTIPNANSSVPSYFQPYIVASHGPFRSKYTGVNYVLNTLLSLHMVIAFVIALVLDNTVPGSRQERGVYEWSESEAARRDAGVARDYQLPFQVGRAFRWVKWVGL